MRVIFLDMDGVLNSKAWREEHNDGSVFSRKAHHIEPVCLARFQRLLQKTEAKLVLSSTWRYYLEARYQSPECPFTLATLAGFMDIPPDAFIGVTPRMEGRVVERKLVRGDEIRAWLGEHPEVFSWAILEDLPDNQMPIEHLVHTGMSGGEPWDGGMLDEHVEQAIQILDTGYQ